MNKKIISKKIILIILVTTSILTSYYGYQFLQITESEYNEELDETYEYHPYFSLGLILIVFAIFFIISSAITFISLKLKMHKHNTALLFAGGLILFPTLTLFLFTVASGYSYTNTNTLIIGGMISALFFFYVSIKNAKSLGEQHLDEQSIFKWMFITGMLFFLFAIFLELSLFLSFFGIFTFVINPIYALLSILFLHQGKKQSSPLQLNLRFYVLFAFLFSYIVTMIAIMLIGSVRYDQVSTLALSVGIIALFSSMYLIKIIFLPNTSLIEKSIVKEKRSDKKMQSLTSKEKSQQFHTNDSTEEIKHRVTLLDKKGVNTTEISRFLSKNQQKKALEVLITMEKQMDEYSSKKEELATLSSKIKSLTNQLADGKLDSYAYKRAIQDLDEQKKVIEEELWNLQNKLFKDDYEKPF